ncbi:MAG: glycosyltransferase family 9 protein [Saprospiraceae bacterium]|nr:glycosyltransferase family 9 protein [Saprospiraceae bacterium]
MSKILFIQTAFLGDVILSTSLIEKWKAFYPDDEVDVLIRKGNEGVFEHHTVIHELLIWDKQQNKTTNLISLIGRIRRNKYDKIFNLQRFLSTGLILLFSGARETIGFTKNPLSLFFTKRVSHEINAVGSPHEVQRNHQLIQSYTDASYALPKIYLPHKRTIVSKYTIQQAFITIAPASVWFTKQYPEEKWIHFLKKLPDSMDIVLLGSKSDSQLCERICNALKFHRPHSKLLNLAGQLTISESAELMQEARMNYVNDSAPLHIASAVNAAVCAIFCSTVPEFGFGPLSENAYLVQTKLKLSCRPCGLHGKKVCPEGHFKCAMEIEDQQLLQCL